MSAGTDPLRVVRSAVSLALTPRVLFPIARAVYARIRGRGTMLDDIGAVVFVALVIVEIVRVLFRTGHTT